MQTISLATVLKLILTALMQSLGNSLLEDDADESVEEALLKAIKKGSVSCLNIALNRGIDVNKVELQTGDKMCTSPLHLACQQGQLIIAGALIQAGANVNLQNSYGISPLYLASNYGHLSIVNLLIESKADVNVRSISGSSPIYIASQEGHCHVVQALIAANANVNVGTVSNLTPIWIASQNGHRDVVKLLIKYNADVNVRKSSTGSTPLYMATQDGYIEIVDLLIKAKADVNLQTNRGITPAYVASLKGHASLLDLLIRAQADVNLLSPNNDSPLFIASLQGRSDIVKLLLKAQAEVNVQQLQGATPLFIAAQFNHGDVVQLLIESQADLNLPRNNGATAIYIAAEKGWENLVELLIKAHADVNRQTNDGTTPLFIASQNGHQQIARILVAAQAQVNLQDSSGNFPLFVAAQNAHLKILELLIQSSAELNLQLKNGLSAIYIAAQEGHRVVVDYLISHGANVSLQRNTGETPLYIAAQNGHLQVARSLIEARADVNLKTKNGETPIYMASQNGHFQIVHSLIKAGADANICTVTGESPLYIASQNGHRDVVKLLLTAQSDVNAQVVTGETPLFIASQNGHQSVVEALLTAQADASRQTSYNATPMFIATQNRHHGIVELLKKALADVQDSSADSVQCAVTLDIQSEARNPQKLSPRVADPNVFQPAQSEELHAALCQSGFTDSRVALQTAVADVLQQILRDMNHSYNGYFIVGSYSEGWGNNLARLDGSTDIESDIDDMMQLIPGRLYHLKGACCCTDVPFTEQADYIDGHIEEGGFASNPAKPEKGSVLRTAVDDVAACRICNYPPIAPLQPERLKRSNIPEWVLAALQSELTNSPCHLVHAAPAGMAGKQLRVSTTFLERRLLRSLNTLQGQLFVSLKYLVKKVIGHKDGLNIQGLKAYHAKTITFRMVEETPSNAWEDPRNLLGLIRRSLEMLYECAQENCTEGNKNGRIMDHFFLCNAGLYLKGLNLNNPKDIIQALKTIMTALETVINNLPQYLKEFKSSLRPLNDSATYYFQPFQIMPKLRGSMTTSKVLKYHEIYGVVRHSLYLICLQSNVETDLQQKLNEMIKLLPDCARTAREALRALVCLKFGQREAAVKVLTDSKHHVVKLGIDWPAKMASANATVDFVRQHLTNTDSAWKFCFRFKEPPLLYFLPRFFAQCIPLPLANSQYFINFDALLHGLRLLYVPGDAVWHQWIQSVASRSDADLQDIAISARYCNSLELLIQLLNKPVRHWVPSVVQEELKSRLNEFTAQLASELSSTVSS